MDISQESIEFHRKNKGKLTVSSKVPIKDRHTLSLAYTPGVGAVSSEIAKSKELVRSFTIKRNSIAVVSDGSSVLGLGNIGPEAALPVMEGKAALFKEFADIDAFPICLDTQDSEEIIKTVKHIAPTFGGINLEDIAAPRCFGIEERLRAELDIPIMHDDQHGTATVVLAGLINALSLKKTTPEQVNVVINGGGAAGTAITNILIDFGFRNIVVCDSKGAIYSGREDLNDEKEKVASATNKDRKKGKLEDVIKGADIFIGVSRGNLVTQEMIRSMAENPVVFALANPVPEIMPDLAKEAGAFIVATGRSDFPNQINNVLAFPGIFRGALDNEIRQFSKEMFIKAAKSLAQITKNPTPEKILPEVFDSSVVKAVAQSII